MSDKPTFFSELKRRNVYKVAVAYVIVSWLIIQAASIMLPAFEAPTWVMKVVISALVLGFPIALGFSWAFEITPEGIKRESEVTPEQSITAHTGRKLIGLTIMVAVIAAGLFAYQRFRPRTQGEKSVAGVESLAAPSPALQRPSTPATSDAAAKSIAVLPFENLSSDKDNAYFADGIQDEILTRLAKIAALKVISRTSTQKYKSAPDNLRDIGKQLGVANLLEGSVQRAADSVHINVQLIRAATDEHLWAETYNRKLDDIFAVEADVAGAIADQLKATLSGAEKEQLASKPTDNPTAYDAYLRGLAFEGRIDDLQSNTWRAIEAFTAAVKSDPNFALGWAHLAREHGFYFIIAEPTSARRDLARDALAKASKLQPDLVETQLSDGFYHYWVERDYTKAKALFEAVGKAYPNNANVPYALGAVARREGRWADSRALFEKAVDLNPQDTFLLGDASLTLACMRDTEGARRLIDRALTQNPGNPGLLALEAQTFLMEGNIVEVEKILDPIEPQPGDTSMLSSIATGAIFSRKYDRAIGLVRAQLEKREVLGPRQSQCQNLLGDLLRLSGDAEGAEGAYTKARELYEDAFRAQPNNADFASGLAWACAGLGDKESALKFARYAVTLLPASKDAFIGPGYEDALARVESRLGEKDDAIKALEHLLATSYGSPPITREQLRLDPDWDNLRSDPRFEKLAQGSSK